MYCLPCFGSKESENNEQQEFPVAQAKGHPTSHPPVITTESASRPTSQPNNQNQGSVANDTNETNEVAANSARNFGFRELAMATKNFRRESLLGESRFGKVYKGILQGTGQVVAVKQLDRHGTKANKEFLAEVMMLSLLRHPNLVELIGYCADGDQRILVYEYMEMGSVKHHLHEVLEEKDPLDWITRMKIASGAAQALEYLHEKTPPILYRNFTSTNIMLDENLEPKLTDYGLVRLETEAGNTMQQRMVSNVSCAPEYEQNGDLTPKSDVYGFGVVLVELITGRKALDTSRHVDEQNLIKWAQPYFKEPKRFPEMADPQLKGSFPDKSLNQAVGVAAMCVQDDPSVRPMISDVVAALSFLTVAPPPQPQPQSQPQPPCDPATASTNHEGEENHSSYSSSSSLADDDYSYSDSEDEDEQQSSMRIKTTKTGYDDKCGTSSSESLYNEDDYWEDESHPEEMSYQSKSKPKSIKRKVTFGIDKNSVSRSSSKGNNNSLKKYSGPSLRKKSVNRKSSINNERDDVSSSSRSKKSFKTNLGSNSSKKSIVRKSSRSNEKSTYDKSSSKQYDSNNNSFSRSNNSRKIQSRSRRSTGEKLKNGKSSDSSFSSGSDESSKRIVAFESRRKNEGESDPSMNNSDVDILDGGDVINSRLFEDTYVPI
ncbi:hypothetical protein QVD17_09062 [Tagetes erecta]|uniref:Protein kinase domain-containing protein n=1 Tax=Tagetes erecta TaxID=13708 RepID=A0AAD8KYN6_TARER|nr:hypothetical protein QVD17_09062 [Tagetes erecta]